MKYEIKFTAQFYGLTEIEIRHLIERIFLIEMHEFKNLGPIEIKSIGTSERHLMSVLNSHVGMTRLKQ